MDVVRYVVNAPKSGGWLLTTTTASRDGTLFAGSYVPIAISLYWGWLAPRPLPYDEPLITSTIHLLGGRSLRGGLLLSDLKASPQWTH